MKDDFFIYSRFLNFKLLNVLTLFMSVCPLAADVSLLFCCTATVSTCDILFLLCLCLDLRLIFLRSAFSTASKGDSSQDNSIDIVSSELHIHFLMMEQSNACECHCDAVLVASHDDVVVADAATGLCNILHTALVGALHIVAEWEEGIATKADASILGYPGLFLLSAEGLWLFCKELLPFALGKYIHIVVADIDVDGVVSVGTANARNEGQRHYLGVLTEPPDVGLVACQSRAMDDQRQCRLPDRP